MGTGYGIGALGTGEAARFFAVPSAEPLECPPLECLAARFRRHAYAPHTHDTYVVGTIVEGCETFLIGGSRYYAGPGDLCLIDPGVVHDGEPAEESYAYRIAYPSIAYLKDTAEDAAVDTPRFADPIVRDPELAAAFADAHRVADAGDVLDRDERLLAVFIKLLQRHGRARRRDDARHAERGPVARALQYLDARYAEQVDLATLAAVAGIPRTRLLRAMKRATGMTPHAWLLDRRVRAARHLLGRGEAPPAEVAQACGFCDQSHLNRVFKARIGISPGAYRAALL